MRILIVNEYANTPDLPGSGRHFFLARYLTEQDHEVTIVRSSFDHIGGSKAGGSEAVSITRCEDVRFITIGAQPYQRRLTHMIHMVRFSKSVEQLDWLVEKPDVVIGSTPHPWQARAALRLARRMSVPFVLEIRDIWPLSITELGVASSWNPFVARIRHIEERLAASADRIITLSPKVDDYLSDLAGQRISAAWIPNGVDISMWPAPKMQSRRPHVVMYAGSMGVPNQIETLVRASGKVRSRGISEDDVVFRFIGSGAAKRRSFGLARSLGIDGLTFEDPVPKSRVPQLLNEASVLWMAVGPSRLYDYGISPNKLSDYLAAGRPVLLLANTVADYVELSKGGLKVPADNVEMAADAIMELLGLSDGERHSLGLRGRAYVERNLTTEILGERLIDVLETVTAARSRE